MGSCDKCFEGRHVRCGGRGGCTCNICSPKAKQPKPKPIYNKVGRPGAPDRKPLKRTYKRVPPEQRRTPGVKPMTEVQKDEIAQGVLALVQSIAQEIHAPIK